LGAVIRRGLVQRKKVSSGQRLENSVKGDTEQSFVLESWKKGGGVLRKPLRSESSRRIAMGRGEKKTLACKEGKKKQSPAKKCKEKPGQALLPRVCGGKKGNRFPVF